MKYFPGLAVALAKGRCILLSLAFFIAMPAMTQTIELSSDLAADAQVWF